MPGLRIVGGQWRGKALAAPAGLATRPTNVRVRQAAFDILLHAGWAGQGFVQSARVLDVFAGTGAYGLEALSRGARFATFIENAVPALERLRGNIAACKAEEVCRVIAADAAAPPPGTPHDLIFLDPPYATSLIAQALGALETRNYFGKECVFVAELGFESDFTVPEPLAIREHGKAKLLFWRKA